MSPRSSEAIGEPWHATWLTKDITASDRAAWTGTKVEVWVNESFDIARQGQVGYCVNEGNSCLYEHGHPALVTGDPWS